MKPNEPKPNEPKPNEPKPTELKPSTPKPDASADTSGETTAQPTVMVERRGARPAMLVAGLAVVGLAALGLYAVARPGDKPATHSGACAHSLDVAHAIDPLVHGEVAALTPATAANDMRAVAFDDTDGNRTSVDAFKGKTILLNLWATWCVPCRQEMPALDKLQGASGSKNFSVIPVDADTVRLDRPKAFFKDTGIKNLPFYSDKTGDILQALKAKGLPTTVLIGTDGCEIGTMAGPAQWDSPDAKALIDKIEKAG